MTDRRCTRSRRKCAASRRALRRTPWPARALSDDAADGSDAAGRSPAARLRWLRGRSCRPPLCLPLTLAELAEVDRAAMMISGAAQEHIAFHAAVVHGALKA